jgi:hypothetical protein
VLHASSPIDPRHMSLLFTSPSGLASTPRGYASYRICSCCTFWAHPPGILHVLLRTLCALSPSGDSRLLVRPCDVRSTANDAGPATRQRRTHAVGMSACARLNFERRHPCTEMPQPSSLKSVGNTFTIPCMQGNKQVTRAAIEFYGPDRAKWLGAHFPFYMSVCLEVDVVTRTCLLHHSDSIWICSQAELHEH